LPFFKIITVPFLRQILLICCLLISVVPDTIGENPMSDPSASPLLRIDGSAGERYRVLGDFNGDGREDMMLSEDIADIGQAGIKLYLYLRDTTDNYLLRDSVFTKPTTLAVEKFWKGSRLWIYSRRDAQTGIIACSEVSDSGLTGWRSLVIYPGDGGTSIGNGIFKAVFDNPDSRLELQKSRTEGDTVNWLPVE
jgi:hypothetical protein